MLDVLLSEIKKFLAKYFIRVLTRCVTHLVNRVNLLGKKDNFSVGLYEWLKMYEDVESIDIYCLTSKTYCEEISRLKKHIKKTKIRILLPSLEAIDSFCGSLLNKGGPIPYQKAEQIKLEINSALKEWEALMVADQSINVVVRYVGIFPSFYVSIINNSLVLHGLYSLADNTVTGLNLSSCQIEDQSKASEKYQRTIDWFNGMWRVSSDRQLMDPSSLHLEMFDGLGGKYNSGYRYNLDQIVHICINECQKNIHTHSPIITDVGCGPADITSELVLSFPGARVNLLDQSYKMLSLTKNKFAANSTVLVVGKAESSTALLEGSNIIILSAVLHLLSSPYDYLYKTAKALAPCGLIILLTYDEEDLRGFLFYEYFPGFKDREKSRMIKKERVFKVFDEVGLDVLVNERLSYNFYFKDSVDLEENISRRQFSALSHLSENQFLSDKKVFISNVIDVFGRKSKINSTSSVSLIIARKPSDNGWWPQEPSAIH